ncbi:MAG: PAS domain-containing protein, partial [Hydrogenophaga sp.]|nr:PAS domain-containing protein [Hydrogenophaga sp.]
GAAIATGSVDLVTSVEDIPAELLRLRGSRLSTLASPQETAEQVEAARLQICSILLDRLGHDFSGYRDKTFLRRVQRRMQVVGATTLQAYIEQLHADPEEPRALFRDLLISVTRFFRDKDTFHTLETQVIPRLFQNLQPEAAVRVWVPGCATGEEAYSLAILLREQMDRLSWTPRVQLFATDIDLAAIATARLGRYPATLLEGLTPARRDRFFRPAQTGFVVAREVRELCTFSEHNLLRDPPLSKLDLVSCRNLLIYLDTEAQEAVIPLFHYALKPDGILVLGRSESVAKNDDLFAPLDRVSRIFFKRNVKSPSLQLRMDLVNGRSPGLPDRVHHQQPGSSLASFTARHLQEPATRRPAPPDGPQGQQNTAADLPRGWASQLGKPLLDLWDRMGSRNRAFEGLQGEVSRSRDDLQTLGDEHHLAVSDLRTANEELQSTNEELQATNEELETSKEELQSLNEELNTVNARLSEKVEELDAHNDDLRNLFASTEIATIFLDRHLVIRSFTPAVAALYKLIPGDQGRPLTDIVSRLQYSRLPEDVAEVLHTLKPVERRVSRDDSASHYLMRVLPYRAADNTVNGALVTFIDVTSIVQAETSLREADVRKDAFIATLSHELRNPLAPIRTAAHLLESPDLAPQKVQELRAVIARQVTHMSSLLDDLFDLSRISRNAFPLKKEYVRWDTALSAAVEAIQPRLDSRRHTLRIHPFDMPERLEADPVRLTQILSNLLTNAVKFTPDEGLIEVSGRLEDTWFVFSVRDNGMGIAPARLHDIFGMFSRCDTDTSRADGGLGIGLALVKGLVELHGGHIEAHSPGEGLGSEFVVKLPRQAPRPASAPPAAALPAPDVHARHRRVLVADDNRDGADTLATFLSLSGHQVAVAYSGEQALQLAAEQRPDACVLDIGMPGFTGYEVAERIRREAWGQHMLLVAVTGWGQEKDRAVALSSGFDHHLTKPINPDTLDQLLRGKRGG